MLSLQGISVQKLDILCSPYKESNLSLSPDGRYLFFMSERGGQPWSQFDDALNRADGDIWVAERKGSIWQKPQVLDETINTGNNEDEPYITPDAQNVFFQSFRSGWEAQGGPYYMAEFHGKAWEAPVGLGGSITSFFREQQNDFNGSVASDGSSWSPAGNLFMFTLGKDRKSPMDIYYAKRSLDGVFSSVEKLDINTPKNERSIFIAADGKTIYFASNGFGGLGGLDIFKATLNDDGSVSGLYNLGEPFNSKGDDYGFIISANGKEAYFIRDGDIYTADLASVESRELKPFPMIIISGKTISKATQQPLESSLDITEVSASTGGDESAPMHGVYSISVRSNSITGMYTAILKPNKKYVLSASASKHKGINKEFALTAENTSDGEYILNVELEPVPPRPPKIKPSTSASTQALAQGKGTLPVIQPIFFDTDNFSIEEKYLDELDKAWEFLKANPSYQAELSGFADDRGSYEYNLRLSQRRVNAVLDYLWSLGCERKRLALKFFGEEEPLASNLTEQGRSKNRRVEIAFFRKIDDTPPSVPSQQPVSAPKNSAVPSKTTPAAKPPRPQPSSPEPSGKPHGE